ncbi:hypothetical protein [Pseudosulfitobacter sp. DSM 107133]|uniref:hypothetical protein n=1 Tax=Pseudosulfitobacter sp. DSM 107133 TaxID=2883100 RepID=UPI0013B3A718|nr:hypothetical protein [Pseudosulfitobacter sp. DSM 107133]
MNLTYIANSLGENHSKKHREYRQKEVILNRHFGFTKRSLLLSMLFYSALNCNFATLTRTLQSRNQLFLIDLPSQPATGGVAEEENKSLFPKKILSIRQSFLGTSDRRSRYNLLKRLKKKS